MSHIMAIHARWMPAEPFAHILITKAVMRHSSIKDASLNLQSGQEMPGQIRLTHGECLAGDRAGCVTQDVGNQGFELSSPERMAAGGQVGHAINTTVELQDYRRW